MSAVPSVSPGGRPVSRLGNQIFGGLVRLSAILVVLLIVGISALLVIEALPSIQRSGLAFLTTSDWDPNAIPDGCTADQVANAALTACAKGRFGALPYIFGTVVTSLVALILATPLAIGSAIFISEYAPRRIGDIISFAIELLVAIPSVVYGLWAYQLLSPLMAQTIEPALQDTLGHVPLIGALFQGPTTGNDILTASLVLTIMILPTILAISREVIRQVPKLQKDGMIALGATKWEAIRLAILPAAQVGITGGAMLGLARAIGETMAVTMTIGNNTTQVTSSLFNQGYTLASGIANRVNESSGLTFSALAELGLVLLLVSSSINLLSRLLVSRNLKR